MVSDKSSRVLTRVSAKLILQIAPQAFDRIEFGTIGGQRDSGHVGRPPEGFRGVKGPIVQHEDVE